MPVFAGECRRLASMASIDNSHMQEKPRRFSLENITKTFKKKKTKKRGQTPKTTQKLVWSEATPGTPPEGFEHVSKDYNVEELRKGEVSASLLIMFFFFCNISLQVTINFAIVFPLNYCSTISRLLSAMPLIS